MIKASDVVLDALRARAVTSKEMAEAMGVHANTLSRKISENRLTANEFFAIAERLGYEVTLTDKSGGSELKVRKRGTGCRVKRMMNGTVYDTIRADAVCHTTTENGWYIELYRDDYGRYFAVHYSNWDGADPFITSCPESDAQKLIQMYSGLEMAPEAKEGELCP